MPKPGSRLVVRERRPYLTIAASVAILAALGWGAWKVYDFGRMRAGFDSEQAAGQISSLQSRNDQLAKENALLRNRVAIAERGAIIDREAYGDVEDALERLQQENLELKQEVAFYQGIISPSEVSHGVRLKSLKMDQTADARQFAYKLVLVQTAKIARQEKGQVTFVVHGMEDGLRREIPLEELDPTATVRHRFGFRYFQNFEGIIILPAGFMPERVVVRIIPDGSRDEAVEKILDWVEVMV